MTCAVHLERAWHMLNAQQTSAVDITYIIIRSQLSCLRCFVYSQSWEGGRLQTPGCRWYYCFLISPPAPLECPWRCHPRIQLQGNPRAESYHVTGPSELVGETAFPTSNRNFGSRGGHLALWLRHCVGDWYCGVIG